MLDHLALLIRNRARTVLSLTGLAVIAAALLGSSVHDRLSSGGVTDPASPSSAAQRVLAEQFASGQPNLVLLVTADGGVDSPQAAAAGTALTAMLGAQDGVDGVSSYWSTGSAALRSADGASALVAAHLVGDDDATAARVAELAPLLRQVAAPLHVEVGGASQARAEADEQLEADLLRAELVALPLLLLVLLFVFDSVVAAVLPLIVAGFAIVGTNAALSGLAGVTQVSVFALNLTTALGLGLAVDYSLFIVRRYREEVAGGADPDSALRTTMQTAGRTVLISAVTVCLSLSALLVFPLYFLRSFAYAGCVVVVLSAVGGLVVLPALLKVLGPRVERLQSRALLRRIGLLRTPAGPRRPSAAWGRLALAVLRRPVVVTVVVGAGLLVLALPFRDAHFGMSDDRILPRSAPAHQVAEAVRDDFPAAVSGALQVVLPDAPAGADRDGKLATYAAQLSLLPGVAAVDSGSGTFTAGALVTPPTGTSTFLTNRGAWLQVVPAPAVADDGEALVATVRSTPAPYAALVGGASADLVDTKAALAGRLWLAGTIVVGSSLLLLFLLTGSVLIPVKAVVLNVLSLTATFGAMVWVFQQGHLGWLVGDPQVSGYLDITIPVILFCVAFGMSMDYEIFLLSRIREEWLRTGDNRQAIVVGLQKVGGIVTAAALLLTVVLLAIGTSQVVNSKLLGIGLALAVVMDATVIRCLLVPALMGLAGPANWWAPDPLARWHTRVGLRDSDLPVPSLPRQRQAADDDVRVPA